MNKPALAIELDEAPPKKGLRPKAISDDASIDLGEEEQSDPTIDVDDSEMMAMNEFDSAKSPEDRAKALKAFIRLCTEKGY